MQEETCRIVEYITMEEARREPEEKLPTSEEVIRDLREKIKLTEDNIARARRLMKTEKDWETKWTYLRGIKAAEERKRNLYAALHNAEGLKPTPLPYYYRDVKIKAEVCQVPPAHTEFVKYEVIRQEGSIKDFEKALKERYGKIPRYAELDKDEREQWVNLYNRRRRFSDTLYRYPMDFVMPTETRRTVIERTPEITEEERERLPSITEIPGLWI